MSKQNATPRNRVLRKVRSAKHIAPEIKLAIQVVLDLLSPKSEYCIAWPSAAFIASRFNRGKRSGKWYLRTIKALGIFTCMQLSPQAARAYCQQKYGFQPKLEKCVTNGPILFEPNLNHPLWDTTALLTNSTRILAFLGGRID